MHVHVVEQKLDLQDWKDSENTMLNIMHMYIIHIAQSDEILIAVRDYILPLCSLY